MPLLFNGKEPEKITFNSKDVLKVICNGAIIWEKELLPAFTFDGNKITVGNVLYCLGDGVLTVNRAFSANVQAQGGGASGAAGNAAESGCNGADGVIVSKALTIQPGSYNITIGASGAAALDSAGKPGSATTLASLVSAAGGNGCLVGNHQSLYETKGFGGKGGSPSDFNSSTTTVYMITTQYGGGGYMYIRERPTDRSPNKGTIHANEYRQLEDTTIYDGVEGDSHQWYKLANDGGYVRKDQSKEPKPETTEVKNYYSFAGNMGVLAIEEK